jgi:hypothetical protein
MARQAAVAPRKKAVPRKGTTPARVPTGLLHDARSIDPITSTPATETTPGLHATPEEIAVRAYAIFERRGHYPGSPAEDWSQAELELKDERGLAEQR